jgi:hypothetical protein
MEKDGWLDQILLGILNLLNETWLGVAVAVGGGFIVAVLARTSPKKDWDFLKEGPANVLAGAFLLLAGLRSAPRLVLPKQNFVCDDGGTHCRFEADGPIQTVYDYTFGDFVREFAVSLVRDAVLALAGAAVGVAVAAVVLRHRKRRA